MSPPSQYASNQANDPSERIKVPDAILPSFRPSMPSIMIIHQEVRGKSVDKLYNGVESKSFVAEKAGPQLRPEERKTVNVSPLLFPPPCF
jgi:hypothetical protein